jgi:hypothetical protein
MDSEVSASNQEAVGTKNPPYTVGKKGKKKLKIATSVSPAIAAKVKPKHTKKPAYKRD